MKRFIYRHNEKYHMNAAIRIMDEVLNHIPDNKKVLVLINQDIKALMHCEPGVYYVATDTLFSNKKWRVYYPPDDGPISFDQPNF